MIQDAFAQMDSSVDDQTSLARLKTIYGSGKAELEKTLQASEDKLSEADHRIQGLNLNKLTVRDLAVKLEKAKQSFITYEERVQYVEDWVSD